MRRRFKLNSGQWARLRRVVLVRDSWKCVKCGRSGRMEVDHIKPLHLGGAWYDLANLQTLMRINATWPRLRESFGRRPETARL